MIKYRANKYGKVNAVEVIRETEKQVVIPSHAGGGERREAKRSDWATWHDTWEDAHRYLIAMAAKDVDSLRLRLEQAKGKLGQIKGMKRPKP